MQFEDHAKWKARLLRRLAVVVDLAQTYHVRLCAVRAVQGMLDPSSSLRREDAHELLSRALNAWDKRPVIVNQRTAWITVRRPPQSLADVWE